MSAPEATSTSKLSSYPKALISAGPVTNADFLLLLLSLDYVSGPNAAELEAELGCESVRRASEDHMNLCMCVSVYSPVS